MPLDPKLIIFSGMVPLIGAVHLSMIHTEGNLIELGVIILLFVWACALLGFGVLKKKRQVEPPSGD